VIFSHTKEEVIPSRLLFSEQNSPTSIYKFPTFFVGDTPGPSLHGVGIGAMIEKGKEGRGKWVEEGRRRKRRGREEG